MRFYIALSLFIVCFRASAQIIAGDSLLQNKPYNEVCFAGTHNSFNYAHGKTAFIYPNQPFPVYRQLQDGIRAFMLDIHYSKNDPDSTVYLYHQYEILGKEKLKDVFDQMAVFLENNPDEVITIIFECYVKAEDVEESLKYSALNQFVFHKKSDEWPLLKDMITAHERVVIFSHCATYSDWYLNQDEYCFENDYNNHNLNDMSVKIIRGDTSKSLYIMNHFVYSTLNRKIANGKSNRLENIKKHLQKSALQINKKPNFIFVDWYNRGDLIKAVEQVNHFTFLTKGESPK